MAKEPLVQQFQNDINKVIDKYRDQGLNMAESIGVLELVKLDLYNEGGADERN